MSTVLARRPDGSCANCGFSGYDPLHVDMTDVGIVTTIAGLRCRNCGQVDPSETINPQDDLQRLLRAPRTRPKNT